MYFAARPRVFVVNRTIQWTTRPQILLFKLIHIRSLSLFIIFHEILMFTFSSTWRSLLNVGWDDGGKNRLKLKIKSNYSFSLYLSYTFLNVSFQEGNAGNRTREILVHTHDGHSFKGTVTVIIKFGKLFSKSNYCSFCDLEFRDNICGKI